MSILSQLFISAAYAQDAVAPAAPASGGNDITSTVMQFAPLLVIFAIFYLLVIRPQQKKLEEQGKMIKALQKGDKVVTSSGIFGKITKLEGDDALLVEIADGVQVKMLRANVQGMVDKPVAANDSAKNA